MRHGLNKMRRFGGRRFSAKKLDRRVDRELHALGWRIVRVWEHELTRKNSPRLLRRLAAGGVGYEMPEVRVEPQGGPGAPDFAVVEDSAGVEQRGVGVRPKSICASLA